MLPKRRTYPHPQVVRSLRNLITGEPKRYTPNPELCLNPSQAVSSLISGPINTDVVLLFIERPKRCVLTCVLSCGACSHAISRRVLTCGA